MSQRFIKGLTNNHLTWVMVDATDFATPESALSAAIKIKIYGHLAGGTGTNFVSSGTGSLTNDITHVGASVTGQYQIALAKADLSDASAAWYNQYVITLSATGAAYQTIIVDGGIMESYLSNVASYLSNFASNVSGVVSDIYSVTSDTGSKVVVMSGILSDTYSAVVAQSDAISDILSRLNSASFLSDIASHVWAAKYTANSAASSFGSLMSDIYSRAGGAVTASDISDIASAVWATALATKLVQLNTSDLSDLRSAIAAGPAATVTASDISDIASAVWATAIGTKTVTITASDMSDLRSAIAAGPAATVTASDISDIASAVWAAKYTAHSAASSFGSLFSDISSRVALVQSTASDAASAAQQANSRALVLESMVSDVDSALSSQFVATSATLSDIYSAASNVNSVLITTRAEPGQATPAATLAALDKLDYLYKAWRNRTTQTATQYSLYGDDATTVHQKATFSDNGTTADRGEVATGP